MAVLHGVRRSRRTAARAVAAAAGLALVLATAGCSGDDGDGDGDGGGSTDEPVVVEVTFEGDTVTPSGERVEVEVGQPIDLEVTADAPGEIHIHTDPEQEIAYEAGTETFELEVGRPGVIEVESHDLDQVIVQLEAR